MKTASTLIATGIVGAVISLAGCSSHASPASHGTPASPRPPANVSPAKTHYTTAQAIADKLKAAGISVTGLAKDTSGGYITQTGGQSYDAQISETPGQTIGSSGIDVFPNPKALTLWTGISQSLGGIAVVGDTWAVSLPSSSDDRTITNRLAPEVAKALGGKIER